MTANTVASGSSAMSQSLSTGEIGRNLKYDALPTEGRMIRLLQLFPGQHNEKISCRLLQANLDSLQHKYTAVSYTWGPANLQQAILLHDDEFLVRTSLHEILHAFRHHRKVRTLWIDALCIDQTSLTERSHQVLHMGEIFAKAKSVKAWLGRSRPDMEKAFRSINEITNLPQQRQLHLPTSAIEQVASSLRLLESRRYWSRAWIVQELMLAKNAVFYSGRNRISWDQLVDAVSMVDKAIAPHLRTIIVTKYLGFGDWSFEELFTKFGHLQCADIRDKFYSLHGMVGHQADLPIALPVPDYSLCINEIFIQHLDRQTKIASDRSQIDFAQSFAYHLSSMDSTRLHCACHTKTLLNLRLMYHGEFHEAVTKSTASGSGGASGQSKSKSDLVLNSDSDMYRFRQFRTDGQHFCPRAYDRAYKLNDQCWYLVHRQSRYNTSLGQPNFGGEVVGLFRHYPNESRYFDLGQIMDMGETDVAKLSSDAVRMRASLRRDSPDLRLQIELGILFKLASFINFQDNNYNQSSIIGRT